MLSLYGAESPDGKGPRWARFLTCYASLVEFGCSCWFCETLEVRVHVSSPCSRSGEVRGRHAINFWSRVTKRASSCHTVSQPGSLQGLLVCVVGCMGCAGQVAKFRKRVYSEKTPPVLYSKYQVPC